MRTSTQSPAQRGGNVDRGPGGSLTFDTIKELVAAKLHTAASTLQEQAGQRGEPNSAIAGYGQQAADWLDRTGDYIGEMDPQQVKADLENQVRHYPGRSLLIAGAAGLLLGALFRRLFRRR